MTNQPTQSDVWNSILSQKSEEPVPAAPYIHPLLKRSTSSSLSDKSLGICTESLGSETGSDVFSCCPPSETRDEEEEDKEGSTTGEETEQTAPSSSILIGKNRQLQHLITRSRSFPPPLPSISRQNGASLRVRSSRVNGRLVLEAVSVKEQSSIRAQREDGRLVISFICHTPIDDHDEANGIFEEEKKYGAEAGDGTATEEIEEIDGETEETGEEMTGVIQSCKARGGRSLLFMGPPCIATS